MNSLRERARGSVRWQIQATRLRRVRDRWVDMPLKQIEQARRQFSAGEVDVLLLSDSSATNFSFDDLDRTLIPDLIRERINGSVVSFSGPGFSARVHKEAVRILATLPSRPKAVVLNLNVRVNCSDHVIKHPKFSYERSIAAMAGVHSAAHPIRYVGRGGVVEGRSERDSFLDLPMHTRWSDDTTIRARRDRISGYGLPPWPVEVEKARFDYFHGEVITPEHPELEHMRELGRRLRAYQVPVVAMWSPPPLQRGDLHFAGEFTPHMVANLAVLEGALKESLPDVTVLDLDFAEDEFEDSRNATEHFSFAGRVKIADALAAATYDLRAAPPTGAN